MNIVQDINFFNKMVNVVSILMEVNVGVILKELKFHSFARGVKLHFRLHTIRTPFDTIVN